MRQDLPGMRTLYKVRICPSSELGIGLGAYSIQVCVTDISTSVAGRLAIRCTYEEPYHNAERFGESQIVSEQPAQITTEAMSSVPLRIAALNPPKSYPVADRWYIPILLQHCESTQGPLLLK
jgi:hypothetical protein